MADLLIAAGADVKKPNHDGATPLRLASINGSAPMIQKLLKAGADANEASPNGETPLMFAARNGNLDAIKVLIDQKADVNAKEKLRGTTPLMWAAEQAHPEAMKLLLASGADYKAASAFDTKGNRAYLAPTVRQRAESAQGAGGIGQGKQAAVAARAGQGKQGARAAVRPSRRNRPKPAMALPRKKTSWPPPTRLPPNSPSAARATPMAAASLRWCSPPGRTAWSA